MEQEKIAPSRRLSRCFCKNRGVSFKCTGLLVAFRPVSALRCAYPQRQGAVWHMAEKLIIWDVLRTLPQQVQNKLTQKSCSWFTHFAQQEFIGAKSVLDLCSVLANICRRWWKRFQFCHVEKSDKIGRTSGEDMETTCETFYLHRSESRWRSPLPWMSWFIMAPLQIATYPFQVV